VNIRRRWFLKFSLAIGASVFVRGTVLAVDWNRPAYFLPEERQLIETYYRRRKKAKAKGLPPGLAKRGGNLPPGLQEQLDKNGRLPPGLQKRLAPLPVDLERRLPTLPDFWERVILEQHVILIDRSTERILDIIENVVALATAS
jgi:hypothetical protein